LLPYFPAYACFFVARPEGTETLTEHRPLCQYVALDFRDSNIGVFMTLLKTSVIITCAGIVALSLSPLLADSAPDNNPKDVLLASGKGFQITIGDFLDVASAQNPAAQKEVLKSEAKQQELLEKLINMNLLAAEARRRGYDRNPEVITVKKNRLATLMHRTLADSIEETPPTEEALRAYYDKNYSKYNKPERIRVRHILISDRKKAQGLLSRLKKENVSQYQFRQYAREMSEDEQTASQGGDLTFISRNDTDSDVSPALITAAFQIQANGDIYPYLVETEAGFHILMRTGYRKAINLQFEDARERIIKLVQRQTHKDSVETALAGLQKKYPVSLYEENLKHVVIDLTKPETGPASSLAEDRNLR
jgi:peptidyl-prolyl cis-trans isomerase C